MFKINFSVGSVLYNTPDGYVHCLQKRVGGFESGRRIVITSYDYDL